MKFHINRLHIRVVVTGPFEANCYICRPEGSREGLIVDPGDDADKILEAIEESDCTPSLIVNTHAHIDHIGANDALKERFAEAVLCTHSAAARAITQPLKNLSLLQGRMYRSPPVDRELEDGDVLELGDAKFTVLHTPGHSSGCICLFCPAEEGSGESPVLFGGDALFAGSVGRTDFPGGSWETLLESIKSRLLTLPDDTVVLPGHGPDTTIGYERIHNEFLK